MWSEENKGTLLRVKRRKDYSRASSGSFNERNEYRMNVNELERGGVDPDARSAAERQQVV